MRLQRCRARLGDPMRVADHAVANVWVGNRPVGLIRREARDIPPAELAKRRRQETWTALAPAASPHQRGAESVARARETRGSQLLSPNCVALASRGATSSSAPLARSQKECPLGNHGAGAGKPALQLAWECACVEGEFVDGNGRIEGRGTRAHSVMSSVASTRPSGLKMRCEACAYGAAARAATRAAVIPSMANQVEPRADSRDFAPSG